MVGIFAQVQLFVNLPAEPTRRAEFHPLHSSSSKEQEMKSVNVSCHNFFLPLPDLLCQIKPFYSSAEPNLRPLLAEKSKGQWKKCEEAHTRRVHSFLCTSERVRKRLSRILLRTCASPFWRCRACVRAHCLKGKKKSMDC